MPDALLYCPRWTAATLKYRTTHFFFSGCADRYRVRIEVRAHSTYPYSAAAAEFPADKTAELQDIYLDFSEADGGRVKQLERSTNHDVKAVEYFIKERMDDLGLGAWKEFMHFGLPRRM